MNTLFRSMNIPKSSEIGNTIFKKLFYENADLSKVDKEILSDCIDKITWAYCLKPDNINIALFKDDLREYSEIEFIEVKLSLDCKTKRLAEIIMRTIPYPMVLLFSLDNKVQLFTAHQRASLSDQAKNTIEEFIFTDWIDIDNPTDKDKILFNSLELKNQSHINFYRYYSDIVDRIITYKASKLTDNYIDDIPADEVKEIYDKVGDFNKQTENLRSAINKETQFNRRLEINIEIKRLEAKKKMLLERLR